MTEVDHHSLPAVGWDAWEGRSRSEWLAAFIVVTVVVGASLLSSALTGSLDIPHNDDWAYSRVALDLARTGELRLVGWTPSSLIGHVLWAQPFLSLFGTTLRVLHFAQAVAAAVGLLCSFVVMRRLLRFRDALLGTVIIAAFPGYALLSTSYMTDTTAFAAQMVCLATGLAALDRPRPRVLLVVSLASASSASR